MQNAQITNGKIDALSDTPFRQNSVEVPNDALLDDNWDGTTNTHPVGYNLATDEDVLKHALALKIGVVNSTRTDSGVYPVTEKAFEEIRTRYSEWIVAASARMIQGQTVSTDDKAVITNIQSGFEVFKTIDTAAALIIVTADATNPISSDARWPTLG